MTTLVISELHSRHIPVVVDELEEPCSFRVAVVVIMAGHCHFEEENDDISSVINLELNRVHCYCLYQINIRKKTTT